MTSQGYQRRSQGRSKGKQCWTLFVANLPLQLHWQGIWQAFDRRGVVVDVFVPRKTTKDGSRFGFVRMKWKADGERVIERFDSLWLYVRG
ncbi:hypothetical protein V6N13_125717 [Hibiscus sabdariffa]